MEMSQSNDMGSAESPTRETPGGFPADPVDQDQLDNTVSNPQSLSQAVKARKAEYVRKKTVKVKIGTWNVASSAGTEKDLGAWFVEGKGIYGLSENLSGLDEDGGSGGGRRKENTQPSGIGSVKDQEEHWREQLTSLPEHDVQAITGGKDIGIYVLGLQEVVPISRAAEALYTDPAVAERWNKAMEQALPPGYTKIAEKQLIGLLILIYASPEIAPSISSVSTTAVGTGLLGWMGNKGAVSVRLVLGETTRLVFIDCHMAAGSDKGSLERRNWDANQIVNRTRFDPINEATGSAEDYGDGVGDEDFGFWFGDLNYRLEDMPGDDVRRLLLLHTKNEYDINNKSKRKIDSELGYVSADTDEEDLDIDPDFDPASLKTTLKSLLPHDQLRKQQKIGKAFHDGWREGEIDFLPTYKYDVGSVGMFDSGEKKRGPSWCDRILFRTRQDHLRAKDRLQQKEESRKKDEEMRARGLDKASEEEDSVLFDYDPEQDAEEDPDEGVHADGEPQSVMTREGFEDSIALNHYASHQRVLSSDHKPLDAVFTLTYDSVVPELRAKVHQEVAKQLDKAENETRPAITIVVEQSRDNIPSTTDEPEAEHSTSPMVDFGNVRYCTPKVRALTLANTGGVDAVVSFIDRPAGEHGKFRTAPPWLTIDVEKTSNNANPNASALHEYSLQPGEAVHVDLTLNVHTLKLVQRLNEGQIQLDDVLVLRVKNGRDHFIPVRGNWLQSCLCRTIDELVLVPESGARSFFSKDRNSYDDSERADDPSQAEPSVRLSAPRELFALTEAIQDLVSRSMAEWDMTHEASDVKPWIFKDAVFNGWPFNEMTRTMTASPHRESLVAAVFEALDTATPLKNQFPDEAPSLLRLEALAESLNIFLSSLQDGIITPGLWAQVEARLREADKFKTPSSQDDLQTLLLEVLSNQPAHNVSFTFIQFMLNYIIKELLPPTQSTVDQDQPPTRTSESGPAPSLPSSQVEQSPVPDPGSPTPSIRSPSSMFSSLSLRGRRRTSTQLSSTSSSGAPISNAPGLALDDQPAPTPSSSSTVKQALGLGLGISTGGGTGNADQKSAMIKSYSKIFAELIIRSDGASGGATGTSGRNRGISVSSATNTTATASGSGAGAGARSASASPAPPIKEKEKKALVERKRRVIGLFLG